MQAANKEPKTPGMLSQNLHSTWHAQALSSVHAQHTWMTARDLPGAHHHKQGKGGHQGCAANPAQLHLCSETKICLNADGKGENMNTLTMAIKTVVLKNFQ